MYLRIVVYNNCTIIFTCSILCFSLLVNVVKYKLGRTDFSTTVLHLHHDQVNYVHGRVRHGHKYYDPSDVYTRYRYLTGIIETKLQRALNINLTRLMCLQCYQYPYPSKKLILFRGPINTSSLAVFPCTNSFFMELHCN